jgi:putative ABC transport system permease protein
MNPVARWLERRRVERELAEEIQAHLDERIDQLMEDGQSDEEARANAYRRFGNSTLIKERSREAWGWNGIERLAQDVRFTLRLLRRSPIFTLSAILTLALGIGANAAIFTLIDDLLLRSLPIREPQKLMKLTLSGRELQAGAAFSYITLTSLGRHSKTLEGAFSWNETDFSLGWGADARRVGGAVASGATYRTLGIEAEAGRLFDSRDDTPGAAPVAVISDRFWASEFDGDRQAIGRQITLEGHTFTIIGVTPHDFLGLTTGTVPALTIPFHADSDLHPKWDMLHTSRMWWLSIFGRLRPGATMAQAQAELRVLSPQILKEIDMAPGRSPADFFQQTFSVRPGATATGGNPARFGKMLYVLLAVSAVVLLICCVNLANLMMARAAAREKELSIRLALGAGRARLIRQLLTESLVLSFAGAVLGAGFSLCGTEFAQKFMGLAFDLKPDARVLWHLFCLPVLTGILFGIAPALGGTDMTANGRLKQARIGLGNRGGKLGSGLISSQVALSAMLLISALLFVKTLRNLKSEGIGFERENLGFIALDSERSGMTSAQLARFYDDLLARMKTLPDVLSASVSAIVPLTGNTVFDELDAASWPRLSETERTLYINKVAPGYFRTFGMPLLQGRDFERRDRASTDEIAVLNAVAARTYFPQANAVGQLLKIDKDSYRIIAVVGDAKYTNLRDAAPRTIFQPAYEGNAMTPNPMMAGTTWYLVVRATTDLGAVVSAVRKFVRSSKKEIDIGQAMPLDEVINGSLMTERLLATLSSFFAVLAAALVAIGLYGVLGYTVTRRTSEIGVRLALGATASEILWMILRQAVVLTTFGVIVGLAAGAECSRLFSALLFETKTSDPVIIAAAAGFLLLLGMAVGFFPARRASRVDPMVALRWD